MSASQSMSSWSLERTSDNPSDSTQGAGQPEQTARRCHVTSEGYVEDLCLAHFVLGQSRAPFMRKTQHPPFQPVGRNPYNFIRAEQVQERTKSRGPGWSIAYETRPRLSSSTARKFDLDCQRRGNTVPRHAFRKRQFVLPRPFPTVLVEWRVGRREHAGVFEL